MRRLLLILAVLLGGFAVPAIASAFSGDSVMYVHLVNVAGYRQSYITELKDDVNNAYWHNTQPIEFSTSGHEVYLETYAQRLNQGTYFNGTAYCYNSSVGPSPDAVVTSRFVAEQDAAAVTLAIAEIRDAQCAPGPG